MAANRSDGGDLTRQAVKWASTGHNFNAEVTHVKAYLEFSGANVGLAGVGRGPNFGRIPVDWTAGQLMNTKHWVRIIRPLAAEEETAKMGAHVEMMEPYNWRPAQIKFCNGMDLHGSMLMPLVVLRQELEHNVLVILLALCLTYAIIQLMIT